jgi:hypothetical protein
MTILENNEKHKKDGSDMVDRYKWVIKDKQGELSMVNKNLLSIDPTYQRKASHTRIAKLAREWSWAGCGVITISRRNNTLYVVDGQHRVMAAMKRSDITHLPAIIFENDAVKAEAQAFIDSNVNRGSLKMIEKFNALLRAGDKHAEMVQNLLDAHDISLGKSKNRNTNSAARLMKNVAKDLEKTKIVFDLACRICNYGFISEFILGGLWVLGYKLKTDLTDPILQKRLVSVGQERLEQSAKRAAAFFTKGGEAVWADGILQEINKNLTKKFELK